MKLRHLALLLLPVFAMACGGSGGGASKPSVKSPFLPEDAALFDGGVEFVDDPSKLTGRWRDQWEQEIADRSERADVVVLGDVVATRVGRDSHGAAFVDLELQVDKRYKGTGSGVISLRARETDPGYRTLARAGDRILSGKYVAFVKWVAEEDSARGRFHLAHASAMVVSAVQARMVKP